MTSNLPKQTRTFSLSNLRSIAQPILSYLFCLVFLCGSFPIVGHPGMRQVGGSLGSEGTCARGYWASQAWPLLVRPRCVFVVVYLCCVFVLCVCCVCVVCVCVCVLCAGKMLVSKYGCLANIFLLIMPLSGPRATLPPAEVMVSELEELIMLLRSTLLPQQVRLLPFALAGIQTHQYIKCTNDGACFFFNLWT